MLSITFTHVGAGMVLAGAAAAAAMGQDWPSVVDAAPAEAQAILFTKPLNQLDQDWVDFLNAVDLGQMELPKPTQALAMIKLDPTMLDLDRALGLVVMKGQWQEETPPIVALLPVANYDNWVAGLTSDPVEDGVASFSFEGDTWYSKQAGDWAAVGLDRAMVADFDAGDGGVNHFGELIGDAGAAVVERSDLVAIIDMEGLAEVLGPAIEEGVDEALANIAMMGGQQADQARQMVQVYQAVANMALEQTTAAVVGLDVGARGIGADMAFRFKPGSQLASFFPGGDEPRNLLNLLSDRPFLFATAMDLQAVDVVELANALAEKAGLDEEHAGALQGMRIFEAADGMAMAIYPSPAGLMGGLLNQMVTVYTGEADDLRESLRTTVTDATLMNLQQMEDLGVEVSAEYTQDAEEIDGVSVDAYTVTFTFPPGAAEETMAMQQAMQFMYGPGGLRGYVVPFDGGVIQTVSRNKVLVSQMLEAVKDEGGLGANAAIESVNDLLPDDPSFRSYTSLGGIVNQIGPMVAMFLPGVDLTGIDQLPPIGSAMSIEEGGMHGAIVVPAPLIKRGVELAMQIQQMEQQQMEDGVEEEEPDLF